MVLLRIRVYPEPVRSRKLCHKWSIFPCYSATAWVPFGQCIHFLLDPYSPSFYSLYISKRVARKNHEQALRHPPPFHCFARPLAGGGGICARFSRAPNKRGGPFRCAGIHPASPHTGGMPSGFRRGCSILQVKSSAAGPGHTSGGVHLSPCPSSDAGPPVFSHPRVPPPFMARPPALPSPPTFPQRRPLGSKPPPVRSLCPNPAPKGGPSSCPQPHPVPAPPPENRRPGAEPPGPPGTFPASSAS